MARDSADFDDSAITGPLEILASDLERTRNAVEIARSNVSRAKQELDQFLSNHFQTLQSETFQTVSEPQPSESMPLPEPGPTKDPETAQLTRQLDDLVELRTQLLERFTPEHPEVADLSLRIEELSNRLADGLPFRQSEPSPEAVAPPVAGNGARVSRLGEQADADHREYQRLSERWETAQRDLESAIVADASAARRLASLKARVAVRPTKDLPRNAEPALPAGRQASHPLALIAILAALALAALAAFKLAGASSVGVFASADEVSAALALPIVGVIPSRIDR